MPWQAPSAPTAPPSPSTGSPAGTTAATARPAASRRASALVRPLSQGRQGRRHRARLPRHPHRRRRLHRRRGPRCAAPAPTATRAWTRRPADRSPLRRPATQTFAQPAPAPDRPPSPPCPARRRQLAQLSSLGVGLSLDFPGQYARFDSAAARHGRCGSPARPTVTVTSRSTAADDAVLFAKVYDVGPDGRQQVLPAQLVAPVRVTDAKQGKTVTLTLPAVDHEVDAGPPAAARARRHRPRLRLPGRARHVHRRPRRARADRAHRARGRHRGRRRCPGGSGGCRSRRGRRRRAAAHRPPPHRRPRPRPRTRRRPAADHRPVQAVRQVRRPVRRTRPVLPRREGPGARPARPERRRQDHHPAHADGPHHAPTPARSGSSARPSGPARPVLSRVGAFVEGAGFLPHLSGRANLELYWQATGRPAEDAHLDEALEIAGLGERPGPRGAHLLPGHAAAARHRPGHARPAGPADPGRADQRPRPAADPRDARGDDPVRGRRPDRHRLQPSAGRGRADLHAPGRHGPRPAGRRRARSPRSPAPATPCWSTHAGERRPSRSWTRSPRCRASAPRSAPTAGCSSASTAPARDRDCSPNSSGWTCR